ncbi:hypothetical protein RRG08_053339 [Elysia crispata]|uniref:Uncharacterized protein n=1 Tax=Elysia crispata TaxID=231223 RepID=A0AAE0ZMF9_9GAST|nr:hypothetical protein RRG08_053339 [Elysia crispata]
MRAHRHHNCDLTEPTSNPFDLTPPAPGPLSQQLRAARSSLPPLVTGPGPPSLVESQETPATSLEASRLEVCALLVESRVGPL